MGAIGIIRVLNPKILIENSVKVLIPEKWGVYQ